VTVKQARRAGLSVEVVGLGDWVTADVVVSTVPPGSIPVDRLPVAGSTRSAILDVVYGGGRTPLEAAATRQGWRVAAGTSMLLHQAARQVELMTGRQAPVEAMRTALAHALSASRP
jgi:shikimate dehydrogenase